MLVAHGPPKDRTCRSGIRRAGGTTLRLEAMGVPMRRTMKLSIPFTLLAALSSPVFGQGDPNQPKSPIEFDLLP